LRRLICFRPTPLESAEPMRPNRLKELATAGRPAVNAWLSIPSAYSAEVMGHQGFDSVTVDLQHGMIGFETAVAMLQAISSTSAVPMARVAKNDPALVMQLLDAGAYGIICPMISTVDDARLFVGACRYPPAGQRSFGPARGLLYGGADYFAGANNEVLTLAMIETREGLDNLDAILAVPGLDGVYVGPNDLSLSLGNPPRSEPKDPEVVGAIQRIADRCRDKGLMAGIFCSGPEAAASRIGEGFTLVTPGNDVGLLSRAAKAAVAGTLQSSSPVEPIRMSGY
jgi:4-hydroxy-2-oxoheptanedioate aldolase